MFHVVTPAQKLEGKRLEGGWKVEKLISQADGQTGGNFSTSYIVRKGNKSAFLKAMDFARVFLISEDPARALEDMLASFNFERDLLKKCKRMSRIVTILDDGMIRMENGNPYNVVQYLIFELAEEGDIRTYIKFGHAFDEAWAWRTIHGAAVGLRQLHLQGIAHQDLKPSNLVVFKKGDTKIADLGRAYDRNEPSIYDDYEVAGDPEYAPPELLYENADPDVNTRRFGCDMYLLGSMIVFFYMNGMSMTQLLLSDLSSEQMPESLNGTYTGSYKEILPSLDHCFAKIINDIENLNTSYATDIANLVGYLCNPDPQKRGHPKNIKPGINQYSLERIVTRCEVVARKAESSLTRQELVITDQRLNRSDLSQ